MGWLVEILIKVIATLVASRLLDEFLKRIQHRPYLHHYYLGHKGRPTKCRKCR